MKRSLNIRSLLSVGKKTSVKRILSSFIVGLSLGCSFAFAQNNLVPNFSFESYSVCPTGFGAITSLNYWFQPNEVGNSSDAYHTCNGDIPVNATYQYPRTGNGYAGIYLFADSTAMDRDRWREYIEVGLTDSLIENKKYCIRFYVNKGNWSMWAIKNIQAVLTNDSLIYNDNNYSYITGVTPVVEANGIITDTLNWVPIEITYTASGGERFLTIGNFSPGSSVIYTQVLPYSSVPNTLGYYLIDDVSIYEQPVVFAGNDTIIPPGDSTQIGTTGRPDIIYSWSPTTGLNNPNIANPVATPSVTTTYVLTVTDTNQLACTNVFTDTIIVVVGYISVEEIPDCNSIGILYPNPAQNSCTYEATLTETQSGLLIMYDLNGKILSSFRLFGGYNNIEIDLSAYANGVYLYKIFINGEVVDTKKLVIAK